MAISCKISVDKEVVLPLTLCLDGCYISFHNILYIVVLCCVVLAISLQNYVLKRLICPSTLFGWLLHMVL
uniref:Putative ovule protein n=1 Tax=Solanum chacoense TaxID=4108 RepID=A0A0V0HXM1_SOLCH